MEKNAWMVRKRRHTETERLGPFRSRLRVSGSNSMPSVSEYISPSRSRSGGEETVSVHWRVAGRGTQTGLEVT